MTKLSKKREDFIEKYCKNKGWNHLDLSPSQLFEIVTNVNYPKIR